MAIIYVDGQKREKLESKRVDKTIKPSVRSFTSVFVFLHVVLMLVVCFLRKWNQEFVFSVINNSIIEIRVYDWNRFSSNKILGKVTLKVSELLTRGNAIDDSWMNLDTRGQIRIICHLTTISPGHTIKAHYGHRLPQLRVYIESDVYYPGQIVRGAVIYNVLAKKKFHSIRLTLDGRSYTQWAVGYKHKVHYYATVVFFNTTSALVGKLDKTQDIEFEPGCHIFPFEYVLPMNLPPSFQDRLWANFNRYTATAHVDMSSGKANKTSAAFITMLSDPRTARPDESLSITNKLNDSLVTSQLVHLVASGHTTAYAGENYSVDVKLENKGNLPIIAISIFLMRNNWFCGHIHGTGSMHRRSSTWDQIGGWEFKTLAGLPIQPGQPWQGTISFPVPQNATPSLHSSFSPLIQSAYRVKVKLATSGNVFTKAWGSSKFLVFMSSRNLQYPHLSPPPEPQGALNELVTAPAPADMWTKIVPGPWDGTMPDTGNVLQKGNLTPAHPLPASGPGRIGSVASLPGAIKPIQAIIKEGHGLVSDLAWTMGRIPGWITSSEEGEGLRPTKGIATDFMSLIPPDVDDNTAPVPSTSQSSLPLPPTPTYISATSPSSSSPSSSSSAALPSPPLQQPAQAKGTPPALPPKPLSNSGATYPVPPKGRAFPVPPQ
jgi:hypothetical protein